MLSKQAVLPINLMKLSAIPPQPVGQLNHLHLNHQGRALDVWTALSNLSRSREFIPRYYLGNPGYYLEKFALHARMDCAKTQMARRQKSWIY